MTDLLVWYVTATLVLTGVFWAVVAVQSVLRGLRSAVRRSPAAAREALAPAAAQVTPQAAA